MWKNGVIASGCIHVYSKKPINPLTQLETGLKKILRKHKPVKAWIEKQYAFRRKYRNKQGRVVTTDGGSQAYASYWNIIKKVLQDAGIQIVELDTTRLPRNVTAQNRVKAFGLTKKKRISADQAETILWALFLQNTGRLNKNKFNKGKHNGTKKK